MRAVGSAVMLSLLALVGGCAYPVANPSEPAYRPVAYEQPQTVDFFYGWIIDIRPSQVHVRDGGYAGIGVAPGLPLPVILGGGYQQGPGSTRNFATIGPLNVFAEAAVPDVPAYEYTVLLDKKTNPPDPYLDATQRPAIIIVQNRYATDIPLAINDRAFVRVVGNVAHVMRADTIPPAVERLVSAGPLPIPLPLPTGPTPCDVIAEVSGECR
jgi:hypothetical protein